MARFDDELRSPTNVMAKTVAKEMAHTALKAKIARRRAALFSISRTGQMRRANLAHGVARKKLISAYPKPINKTEAANVRLGSVHRSVVEIK
jgi:hypothetical protein